MLGCWDGAGAPHPFPKRLAAGLSDARHPLRSFVSSWLVLDGMQLAGWFFVGLEREGAGSGAPRPLGLLPTAGSRSSSAPRHEVPMELHYLLCLCFAACLALPAREKSLQG